MIINFLSFHREDEVEMVWGQSLRAASFFVTITFLF